MIVCAGAGSRFEPRELNGVAHLLEHAAFLGAGSRDYRAIRETIDKLGGDVSAETSEEVILYWGSANEQRDFAECLDLVADLVLAPRFDPDSLRREVGTVIQEISGAGDDVFQTVVESSKRLLWGDGPLGRHVGGTTAILRTLEAPVCREYWAATHAGDRMFVLVVGTAAESKLARGRFGAEYMREPVAPSSDAPVLVGGARFAGLPMWGEFTRLCFGLPGISWRDPRLPAMDILNGVLGRDETSHLWERVRGQGLSYSTESFVDCFSDSGWVGVLTDAPTDATADVVQIVCEEITTLPDRLDREEFERARESHIARVRNDELAAPLEWAKYQAMHAYFLGKVPTVEATVRDLERATFEEAQAVAADLLRPERLVLSAGGPERCLAAAE
ncbi:MAG: insulinase family protein, partial [Chloroflexi bacterium]|nr:insulinase family protein [Chloroflexota bacterium]